ncbi:MAG: D-glycero-beta-D-manno-heptose-7-phosphate kinase [Acidobacteria bacterium]|nr:D-glycero-beta-D-manno-heptose-7-phosphate kinase [Acidobacteriota bacterium]
MFRRYDCDPESLVQAIRKFRGKRILVLGDMMLDRFIWGSVSRISPEAPVPVVEIKTESTCLGGAANVASNIHSLGGVPIPLGILGDDYEGERLREQFRLIGSPVGGLIVDKSRPTSIKTRILAHHQQVCRTDREDRSPLSENLQMKAAGKFKAILPDVDAVVVSDYAKGLISAALMKQTLPLAKSAKKIVCIDPKMRKLSVYKPATVITPNTIEAEHASGITIFGKQDLVRAGKKIIKESGIEHLLITRGEEGMALFESNSRITYIPTVAREVYDVTGAGDTVISTLALSLVSGLSILHAAILSNIAAGIVVGKLGTASASPDELISAIRNI